MFNPLNELARNTHHNFTESDAPEICGDSLDSLSSHMQVKDVDYKPELKRMEVPLHKEEYDSPYEIYDMDRSQLSDVQEKGMDCKPQLKEVPLCKKECDSSDETDETDGNQSLTYGKKHKNKIRQPKYKQLDLQCGWLDCNYRSSNLDHFVHHVSLHIPHLEVKENQNHEGVYACSWESCGFESFDSNEIVRHVNFHSYHTKIKCIGSNILAQSELLGCTFTPVGKNLVPNLPRAFTCSWDDCERTFNNSQMYFCHVQTHVHHNPHGHKVAGGVRCSWRGCKSVFRSVYKLAEHIRSHTKEKVVGCPTCGGLFANKVKFVDHCKRQVPLELQGYQCSHCSKFYASERLLRDHMCHHSNAYKCPFCDMACPSPSGLTAHIRYKHLDSKPFKCNLCEFTAKTQYDLKCHLNTHSSEPRHCCAEEGCTFSCRSGYGLHKHYHKSHHRDDEPMYCCHICDNLFQRGSLLTQHLMVQHSIFWPPGHSRFRYKCDDDGYFRLQRLKGTQKMKHSPPRSPQPLFGSSRYNLRRVSGRRFEVTVSEHEDGPQMKDV